MSQNTPPTAHRAPRPPRFNINGPNSTSAMSAGISMPPTAQPPYTAQTQHTMTGPAGQPYWPQYANPFAAGNFMAKGFEGFVDFTKSGMSFGEKFTYGLYNKFSKWSKKWFTHVFLFIVVMLYTIGGAMLFNLVEGEAKRGNNTDYTVLQIDFFEALTDLSRDIERNSYTPSIVNNKIMSTLRDHTDAVDSLMPKETVEPPPTPLPNKTSSAHEDWKIFWNQMFYAGTVYTTIGKSKE